MGLFGPYQYKTKSGQKFFLHVKEKGKTRLYYFSKDSVGALNGLPRGFEVIENPQSGLPFLKKKAGGGILPGAKEGGEKTEEKPTT
jgi:hypothetical protein